MIAEIVFAATVSSSGPYTVQPGDTLSSIGAEVGCDWHRVYEANSFAITDPNRIYPGMVIQIPRDCSASTVSSDAELGFSSSEGTVVVVAGQSLSEIGSILGVSWQAIAEVNGITAPYVIYPGQELRLP